jgi:hypothetical protein
VGRCKPHCLAHFSSTPTTDNECRTFVNHGVPQPSCGIVVHISSSQARTAQVSAKRVHYGLIKDDFGTVQGDSLDTIHVFLLGAERQNASLCQALVPPQEMDDMKYNRLLGNVVDHDTKNEPVVSQIGARTPP